MVVTFSATLFTRLRSKKAKKHLFNSSSSIAKHWMLVSEIDGNYTESNTLWDHTYLKSPNKDPPPPPPPLQEWKCTKTASLVLLLRTHLSFSWLLQQSFAIPDLVTSVWSQTVCSAGHVTGPQSMRPEERKQESDSHSRVWGMGGGGLKTALAY